MRAGVPLLLLAALVGSPEVRYFRYERPLLSTSSNSGQTCLALDPSVFARTAPNLADLRLFREGTEVPYAIHLTAPAKVAEGSTPLLNLGVRDEKTVFDAAMPSGTYSDLQLDLNGENFIAIVTISGSREPGAAATQLGTFTIFDFTREKLGRSTVLHLPDSDFGYLHFFII